MAYDIFLQGFADGEASGAGGGAVREVLRPYLRPTAEEPERLVIAPDSGADIYLSSDSLMVNHAEGLAVFDLLVDAARAGCWTIMPVGLPAAVANVDLLAHLPEGLDEGAVVVGSGADLLRLIES